MKLAINIIIPATRYPLFFLSFANVKNVSPLIAIGKAIIKYIKSLQLYILPNSTLKYQ